MAKKRKVSSGSKRASTPKAQAKRAMSIATDEKKTVKQRVAAWAKTPLAVCDNDKNLKSGLKVLADQAEPLNVRLSALQAIQAASFSVISFEACRSDYIATLRKVAQDPEPELRQRALGILAREKDGFAQKKLLDGLRDPKKSLVPPEKALQLLSYDVHADAYKLAREVIDNPPNPTAKREALRLLAADAKSAPVFEKILRNKKEEPEYRQISAAALHAINPDKLQEHAREIVLDTGEKDDIHALCLTALTQFGDRESIAKDETLMKRVDRLQKESSRKVKQTAKQFQQKYPR